MSGGSSSAYHAPTLCPAQGLLGCVVNQLARENLSSFHLCCHESSDQCGQIASSSATAHAAYTGTLDKCIYCYDFHRLAEYRLRLMPV